MTDKVSGIITARDSTHGDYVKQCELCESIKKAMHSGENWQSLAAPQREALDMIAVKIARILTGNAYFADHWDDIAGYAKLSSNNLSGP